MQHQNNLHQIYLSLANFESTSNYGKLPPPVYKDRTGRPICSWRFLIMPWLQSYMGMPAMVYDEPWDASANEYWAKKPEVVYCWPDAASSRTRCDTNIVANTGPGTPFEQDRNHRLQNLPDGTILLLEIANSGIHYMAPGDLSLDAIPKSIVSGVDGDGFHVVFADGSIWFLSASVPVEDVKKFCTIEGAKTYDREQILGPYAISRSYEPSRGN